jgi:hypothetical protein
MFEQRILRDCRIEKIGALRIFGKEQVAAGD